MAPVKMDCNNKNQNGCSARDPEPTARSSRDDGAPAKEPVRTEPEDFDMSDCFTNETDDMTGGTTMVGSKRNGSFVNIEASLGTGGDGVEAKPSVKPMLANAMTVIDLDTEEEESQDSLDTRIQRTMANASLIMKKEIDENEDPEIVQLKKVLYNNPGEIDYDLDFGEDDKEEKPPVKIDAEPKVEPKSEEPPMVVIKMETTPSPVKQSLEGLKAKTEAIPTIDLTSSDDEIELPKKEIKSSPVAKRTKSEGREIHPRKAKKSVSNTSVCSEYMVVKAEEDKLKIRRTKRKSKKRSKRRESSSGCELIEDTSTVDRKDDIDEKHSKSSPKDPVVSSDGAKPDQKDAEPKEDVRPVVEQVTNRRRSNESDYVRATITKELETPADSSDQKVQEEESGPFVNTDIALEDLLNDFLEDETVPQNPSQVLFSTESTEEDKLLISSPLVDCERMLLAELDNILKDDKPDNSEEPPEQALFTYTIYESGPTSEPLNITVSAPVAQPQTQPEELARIPKPRFRIVNGREKYPPLQPVKKRLGRPPKVVEPPPRPATKTARKKYDSDEDYIPSFARTRRVSLRPRRPRRRAPRARLVAPTPNGYFLTELQLRPEPDPEESPAEPVVEPAPEPEQPEPAGGQSPLAASDGEYMSMPSLEGDQAAQAGNGVPKKRKRGRASKHQIEDYFGPSPVRDTKDSQPTEETPVNDGKKPQVKRRKKRSRLGSSSEDETTATESLSLAATISTITTTREEEDDEQLVQVEPEQPRTEEMRVVLSPLTDEKIEKLSKCNTPKKARAQTKATQTELEGLTWRIDLSQIDFHSEYFEKLYQLITNGRQLRNQTRRNSNNNFEGVVMVGRDAVLPPTPPERSPQRPPPPPAAAAANGRARSDIERLLFERVDEVEFVTAARVDPAARERMERSVRANFRIPKITKQPSRSPQDVTSSTQHDNEDDNRRSSSGSGYINDRPVASDPRRHIAIGGSRSPLRVENVRSNRPEVAAPATVGGGDTARPLAPIRRTIQNNNVQQQQPMVAPPIAAQTQPIENVYPTYGPSEQRPPQPQQYRVSSGVNMPQQQPQPLQQVQQLGAYSASGPEVDVKPNISSLNNPVAMLGSGFMNPNRFFDSINLVCTLTMLQMQQQMQQQQQQLQFPAMSVPGQMFPGPSVVPTAAAVSNPAPAPPPPASCAAPRFVGVPDGGGGQLDEVSDQISQIFGCIDSLKGRCIKNPCQYSHSLPAEADLRQILLGSAQDVVMTTYQFIVGQDHLFLRYFPVYTEVMGRRNMRHQLVDAVPHCEQSKRAFSHYRFIVDGLMINGTLTRSKAVQLVLDKHRKISFDQINVLITLILDTGDDIPQFLQWLEHFSQVQDYHFEIPSINRLLAFCVRSSRSANVLLHGTGADVAKLTYRLVMGVASGKEPFVDTDSLAEYAELLMKSNLGLDHEKILHKYRKNEMSSSAARH